MTARIPRVPAAPFAVNQIVHKSNARLEQDLELTVKWKAPIVITSLGAREDVNDAVHSYGGLTMHDIINDRFAHKAIEKGADGIIAVAAGAGGHAGPISPFALVQEIREWFDGPLALSGAIATGGAVLAAQAMGADLAYIGSAFIATEEARAIDAYKQAIVAGRAEDIVGSNLFTGVYGNYLKPSVIARGTRSRQSSARGRQDHEFRLGRRLEGEGVEGHLGLGPGHRRGQIGDLGRRTRRAPRSANMTPRRRGSRNPRSANAFCESTRYDNSDPKNKSPWDYRGQTRCGASIARVGKEFVKQAFRAPRCRNTDRRRVPNRCVASACFQI